MWFGFAVAKCVSGSLKSPSGRQKTENRQNRVFSAFDGRDRKDTEKDFVAICGDFKHGLNMVLDYKAVLISMAAAAFTASSDNSNDFSFSTTWRCT